MKSNDPEQIRVLLVEDDLEALKSLLRAVRQNEKEYEVETAATPEAAIEALSKASPHVVVLDLSLNAKEGVESGFRVLSEVLKRDHTTRVIVVTGHADLENGIRAVNAGASSFVAKPPNLDHLMALIRDAATQARIRREYMRVLASEHKALERLVVGISKRAHALRESIVAASRTLQPVLIRGETGTGKNLCAEAIHKLSTRAGSKFVRYQTTFASADLTSSDLFGHTKGAFTGADTDRAGLIQNAAGGTLFLDEVQALPVETQVALLGVLQDQRVRPVGGNAEYKVDFRLISATNADVREQLEDGTLRPDFYHRISGFEIDIPALRDRIEDVPVIAELVMEQFQVKYASPPMELSVEARDVLLGHQWPGNIRELQAVIESAAWSIMAAKRAVIEPQDIRFKQLPTGVTEVGAISAAVEQIPGETLEEKVANVTSQIVQQAVNAAGGNLTRAAQALGTSRWTVHRALGDRKPRK